MFTYIYILKNEKDTDSYWNSVFYILKATNESRKS